MTSKRILELVKDIPMWNGDVYKLAMLVATEQREDDAVKAEAAGNQELADAIRAE
jgi:hypothetical protein